MPGSRPAAQEAKLTPAGLGRPAFVREFEMRGGLALLLQLQAGFAAGFGLAVERLGKRCGAAGIAGCSTSSSKSPVSFFTCSMSPGWTSRAGLGGWPPERIQRTGFEKARGGKAPIADSLVKAGGSGTDGPQTIVTSGSRLRIAGTGRTGSGFWTTRRSPLTR